MLTIIIGIVIFLVLIRISIIVTSENLARLFIAIGTTIGVLAICIAIFYSTKYGEWEQINKTELVTLSNSTITEGGGALYVSISGENTYTYRYEIVSEFGTDTSKEYVVDTVSGNVIESEDVNCKNPVLLEYRKKPKITIWTFGFLASKTKYVFYVPEGTIQKEVSLK